MKCNSVRSIGASALVASLAPVMAQAAHATLTCPVIVSGNAGTCYETVDLGNQSTNFSVAGILDQFNPNSSAVLGAVPAGDIVTLASAVISGSGSITSTGTVTNNAGSVLTYTFSSGLNLSIYGLANAPAGFPTRTLLGTYDGQSFYNYTLTEGSTLQSVSGFIVPNASFSYSQSGTYTPNPYTIANFAGFIGSGTFGFGADGTADNTQTTTGGNLTAAIVTTGDPMVTLTYNYTIAVPEPASITVLGISLVTIGLAQRRARRQDTNV